MIFTLTAISTTTLQVTKKRTKDEETYAYVGPNGEKLKFHAHPTRRFEWVGVRDQDTNEAGAKLAGKIIGAWVKVMMDAINEDGNWHDAIKTIKV